MDDHTIQSSVIEKGSINDMGCDFLLEKTEKLTGRIYLLVYKHHEVQIGLIENRQIRLEHQEELTPEYLKELRAFSQNGELYVWNQKQALTYRLRIDHEGETTKIYDDDHYMWGNKVREDRRTIYEQNRGMELMLPFEVSDAQLPLKYRVRNYYDYDDNGLIRFSDARLVRLLSRFGKEL